MTRLSMMLHLLGTAALTTVLSQAADAQTDAAAPQAAQTSGDIIVTAQRRSERLQDVPASGAGMNYSF